MPRQPNLFGQTPAAVRQAMLNEQLQQAQMIGQLGPGGHGALAGMAAGRGIGQLFGAPEDPRLAMAQNMERIGQEMEAAGIEPNHPEFPQQVYKRLIGAGIPQQVAIQAYQQALETQKGALEVSALRNPPEVAQTQNLNRALQAIGVAPVMAEILAPIKEVATAVLKNEVVPKELGERVQAAMFATGNNVEEARKIVRESLKKTPLVSISNEGKIQQAVDMAKAKDKAATEISAEKAAPILQEYAQVMRNRPDVTDLAAMKKWALRLSAMRGPAAQAYAVLRNPGGRLTDEDIKQAQNDLPGMDNVIMGNVEDALRAVELGTKINLRGEDTEEAGSGVRVRIYNPMTGKIE